MNSFRDLTPSAKGDTVYSSYDRFCEGLHATCHTLPTAHKILDCYMRGAARRTPYSTEEEEGSNPGGVRRSIQHAIDSERAGLTRAQARGAITLPVPSVFLEIPGLHIEEGDVRGHRFRCNSQRENCSVVLQSSAYFVHILQGKNFISRTIINRPVLLIRSENKGVRITGFGFPELTILHDEIYSLTERFPSASTPLATAGGETLDPTEFNSTHAHLFDFYKGEFLSMAPFEPIDLIYTLDFSEPEMNYFENCRRYRNLENTSETNAPVDEDICSFEIEDIAAFTLSQCDDANGPCPSNMTNPVEDLKTQNFDRSSVNLNVPMGFLDNGSNEIFAIANRAIGNDSSTGLIDLPNRTAIVEEIIIDYLTVIGFSEQSAEFEQFLDANPDLNVHEMRSVFQQVSPSLIQQSLRSALGRQPQLGAWHGYAQYIAPELLDGLARDLVKLGLARPY